MLIILSPSKTIDTTSKVSSPLYSEPCFIKEGSELVSVIKELNTCVLSKLMSVSSKLSQLNYDRYQMWNKSHNLTNSKQAILSFKGEVYTGLNASSFSDDILSYSQEHLIILSGLYGILRPLDLIQPYRLEISTKISMPGSKDLYTFWQDRITNELNNILLSTNNNTLINLASNEYFKAIDLKNLTANIVTPVFKDKKNGSYKIISIYAKKARGLMTQFILTNKIDNIDDLKHFEDEGYFYSDNLSKDDQLVFTRG